MRTCCAVPRGSDRYDHGIRRRVSLGELARMVRSTWSSVNSRRRTWMNPCAARRTSKPEMTLWSSRPTGPACGGLAEGRQSSGSYCVQLAGGVTRPVTESPILQPMPDDSLLWTHKPAPRCRPRPGEPLWSVQKGDVTWSAELRFHGEIRGRGADSAGWRTHHREDVRAAGPRGWVGEERAGSAGKRRAIGVRAALFLRSRPTAPASSLVLDAFRPQRRRVRFFPSSRRRPSRRAGRNAARRRFGMAARAADRSADWPRRQRRRIDVRDDRQHARGPLGGIHRDVGDCSVRTCEAGVAHRVWVV